MKVLVTGATGLLGRAVVRRLRAAGHEVRSLVHATAVDRCGEIGRTEITWGDVGNEAQLGRYVQGCDAVVHCAWQFARDGDAGLYERLNVAPAVALLRAAHGAGARHFVFISSVSVYGLRPRPDGQGFDEDSPFCSHEDAMDVYPRTKQKCELEVSQAGRDLGMDVTIIRPGLLYSDEVAPVKKMIRGKIALFAGMGGNHLPYVHVDAVAELIAKALEDSGPAEAAVYNAVPSTTERAKDVFRAWKARQGSTAIPVYLPSPLFKLLALAPYLLKKLLGRPALRPNVEYQTRTGTRNVTYSAQRARERFGWTGY